MWYWSKGVATPFFTPPVPFEYLVVIDTDSPRTVTPSLTQILRRPGREVVTRSTALECLPTRSLQVVRVRI